MKISLLELKHAGCEAGVCCRLCLCGTDATSSDVSIQLVMGLLSSNVGHNVPVQGLKVTV